MKKLRNKNQNYDAWLHWDVTKRCNLDCEYCFGKITDASIKVHSIEIVKLISTLDKTGKTFRISFTGGEPTLVPNIVEACNAITEKHYISFNSNLISKNINQFVQEINPDRVLHIHASFHYDELLGKNLLIHFVQNYNLLKNAGFNIYAEAVAYPKIREKLDAIVKFANQNDIILTFAPFYGNYNGELYPENYTSSDLELFGINQSEISCFTQKGELCNAGYNAAVVFSNGNVYPCHQIKTKIGNIYEGVNFNDTMVKCPSKKCGCPLNKYDEYLFGQTKTN
ncbi:MAG: radical SAM protein [Melioribacteraceae bacterium]|jgi:MoaA/NifB/PqqE/SkfB family radical SAM enzyme|nr:radical SAM protein [Melioribacteraceae bacterium]